MKAGRLFGLTAAVLVALATGSTGEAMADNWSWTHGSAATVRHPDRANYVEFRDVGLVLDLKHGKKTWITIPLQAPPMATPKADKIQLFYGTGSHDVQITAISVYDGAWQKENLPITPFSSPSDGYYAYQELSFLALYPFNYGMGISLEITAGSNSSLDHRFALAGAGAHWVGTLQSPLDDRVIAPHEKVEGQLLPLP